MTKQEFLDKVQGLLPDLNKFIMDKAEQVTQSGAIEFGDYENDFFLAKAFMSAIGGEIEYQYHPLTEEGKKIKRNLAHFL